MSFVIINPNDLAVAVAGLERTADGMDELGANAAPPTQGVVPPGKDCVSIEVAERLVAHAQRCQQVISRASNTLLRFADHLKFSAAAYSAAEADNTQALGGLAEGDTSTANVYTRDTSHYQTERTRTNTAGPYAPDDHVKYYDKYCKLAPEINSDNIYNGSGPASLDDATGAWKSLWFLMASRFQRCEKVLTELQAKWSGPAATQMAEAAAKFRDWMYTFYEQLNCTHRQVENISFTFRRTCRIMTSPNDIAENRRKAKEAAESCDLGAAQRKAQLEAEYQEFCIRNITAMQFYDRTTDSLLAALPSWEEPPLPPNTPLSVGPRSQTAR
ncbi:PE family protein [Mycobacterium haemophilum]|uniref:PPE family domain-containing protein n=1 Tax=Mycobacterium haemophilum TaxID=29311 RepID=A0A0I9U7M8_9MYCO|nr:PE family protein [Mycobacterium haemophilum]KLO33144.1 hypothetical protein ABH39_03555 [Mycobacterium haemophilum]KLO38099.1 hypothetical protein ABH38_05810 [Mycobacterium haemophilum]KLO44421.1 hypothetical protein ABH37_04705 [Mycobacterium haemophilum]KLO49567.1 hypothetical protein ABH36_11980 [Mycobacterium haemophilum]